LTYLVDAGDKKIGFLSWDMALLKAAKGADFSTLADDGTTISFKSNSGEEWNIPVDRHARSFLIHFRSHTADFRRISFYKVLEGDFDPSLVRGKIVLVGLLSSIFGDLHNTPIGWLPGITLNANVVSALYSHDFLREIPAPVEIFIIILGILLAVVTVQSQSLRRSLIPIIALIALFLGLSFILLSRGYVWNYAIFPLAVLICPLLAKKIMT
ncbi:MAG: CHASE2 domain-containing protein, partial [Candidatus Omnitrophica bacterium]|nr:CHASE2 domain-containing protein [Candidatus Omnitrophota bacterium]